MKLLQNYNHWQNLDTHVWYRLYWPHNLDAQTVVAWLDVLVTSHTSQGVNFVIIADAQTKQHYITVPLKHQPHFTAIAKTFLPNVGFKRVAGITLRATMTVKLQMNRSSGFLNVQRENLTSHAILTATQALRGSEQVCIRIALGAVHAPARNHTDLVTGISPGLLNAYFPALTAAASKASIATWDCGVIIGIQANRGQCQKIIAQEMVSAFKVADAPGAVIRSRRMYQASTIRQVYAPLKWPLRVTTAEVANMLAWPYGDAPVQGIIRQTIVLASRLPWYTSAAR